MTFSAKLSGVECQCLLDTGSTISIINKAVFDALPNASLSMTATRARTAAQDQLPLVGRTVLSVQIGRVQKTMPFYVSEVIDVPCLFGIDFLQHVQPCVIDLQRKCLSFVPTEAVRSVSAEAVSVGSVVLGKDVTVPPGSETVVRGFSHNCDYRGSALVEPSLDKAGVEVVRSIVDVSGTSVPLVLRNSTDRYITVPKHAELAQLEVGFSEEPKIKQSDSKGSVNLEDLVNLEGVDVTPSQKAALFHVLKKYEAMFDGHVGHTTLVEHRIDTGDSPPIRQAPRRIPPHLKEEVKAQLDDLVRQGILEESEGTWASPICVVRKKNGSARIVADLRRLNSVSRVPAYPIARIDDTLDALSGSSLFCTLDMNSAYHQMSIAPEDREKATIVTPFSCLQFTRVCFGLAGAPASCARLLNIVLGDIAPEKCVSYFDDIIVHGSTFQSVLESLDCVLSRLMDAGLTLNLQKCQFFRKKVTYLGHEVSGDGIRADPVKVEKVRSWSVPRTAKQMSSFLGLASYFRKYIRNFADIAAPLFRLTVKDVKFEWSDSAQIAFDALKKALCESPVLAFPRFNYEAGEFILETDASGDCMGAVLLQVQDGVERPIAYGSQTLSKSQRNYSTTKRELLACVHFVQHFNHYLQGAKFRLRTDHSSLQWLLNFKNPTGMLARWFEILGNYQFDISYRPGSTNTAADGLSRRPESTADVGVQTDDARCYQIPGSSWPTEFMKAEQEKDAVIAEVVKHLSVGRRPHRRSVDRSVRPLLRHWSKLTVLDGVLYRKYRRRAREEFQLQLVVPRSLLTGVLTSLHSGPTAGHPGPDRLHSAVARRFFWVGMMKDVQDFCKRCEQCSSRSQPVPRPRAALGELHASEPFETVAIDLLTNLPTTPSGHKHLLVVIDHFTRWCEVYPLKDMSATTVASTLVNEYFSRYGCPKKLHSDCAANFTGQVIAEMCRLFGIQKTKISAYHPQGDGKVERMMRTLLSMLSKYLEDNHDEWDVHLPLLMLGYRSHEHSALGYSPYFLMFGREPRLPVEAELEVPVATRSQTVADYVDKLRENLRVAHKHALVTSDASHEKNKRFYDKKLNEFDYKQGDLVFLYKAVVPRGQYYKFVRPWKPAVVVAKVGDLNYRIRVAGSSKTLLVHHNRLKPRSEPVGTPRAPAELGSQDVTDSGAALPEASSSAAPAAVAEASGSAGAGIVAHLPILRHAGTTAQAESRLPVSVDAQPVEELPPESIPCAAPVAEPQSTPVSSEVPPPPPPVPLRRSERRTRPPDRFVPGT